MRRIRLLASLVCAGTILGGLATAGPAAAAVAPANDTLGGATVVAGLPFSDTVDTTGATSDADDAQANASNPFCSNPFALTLNKSVWYKFTAGTEGGFAVDTSGSDYAVGVAIATGTPGALTVLTCGSPTASTPTDAGTTYYINAFDLFDDVGGTLDINFLVPPPPPTLNVTAVKGTVNRSGVATITFSYTCTNGDFADALIFLSQAVGRFTIIGEGSSVDLGTCDGTPHTLSTPVFPFNGKFSGGKADLSGDILVCGSFECTLVDVTQGIQLRRNGK